MTFAERLAASIAGLMNITLPVNVAAGQRVGRELAGAAPPSPAPGCDDGTETVRSSSRLSTIRNIGSRRRPCSRRGRRRSPRASATTPSIGATSDDLASRAWAVLICARAAAVAASAASTAVFASSRFCGVIRPYSLSCCARSYSRRARDSATRACASAAFRASMPASVSRGVEPRQRRALAHRHPLGHVDRRHDAGHLRLHVGGELRRERADDLDALLEVRHDDRADRHGHRRLAGRRRGRRFGSRFLRAGNGGRECGADRDHSGLHGLHESLPSASPYCRRSFKTPSNTRSITRRRVSTPTGSSSG